MYRAVWVRQQMNNKHDILFTVRVNDPNPQKKTQWTNSQMIGGGTCMKKQAMPFITIEAAITEARDCSRTW